MEIDKDLFNLAGLEDFYLDRAFLGFDHGDNIAALDPIAGLHQPFDQRPGLHIGAERRHTKFDRGAHLWCTERSLCSRKILGTCGIAAFSRWLG